MDNMGGKRDVVKRAWTAEEDAQLLRLVEEHGPRRWSVIAAQLYGRVGKLASGGTTICARLSIRRSGRRRRIG